MKRRIQIGVIGDSSCSEEVVNLAYRVGKEIAINNAILLSGGRSGVMFGASKGCKENGGLVVGILPGINEADSQANEYLDVAIPTNLGWTRNSIVPMASDGIIVIGGRAGTLSEISFAWMYNKPIVSLIHESLPDESWSKKLAGIQIDNRRDDMILGIKDPKDAVSLIISKILEKNNLS